MPRYFFHTEDGEPVRDGDGTELADHAAGLEGSQRGRALEPAGGDPGFLSGDSHPFALGIAGPCASANGYGNPQGFGK
jgi:hypothetical protein